MKSQQQSHRKNRARQLIQLVGELMEKAGLLETFHIELGMDLQKDPEMKEASASLFKGPLLLNEIENSDAVPLQVWTEQGLEALRKSNH